jgi:hypothetical protein
LLIFTLSLPLLNNFNLGQHDVWLAICAGEFIRAINSKKYLKAGFWLSGWLFKPQLLILIIPFLLLTRSLKALKGFAISSFIIFFISYILIGFSGFKNILNILLESATGGVGSCPRIMINWRLLGTYLSTITNESVSWYIVLIGRLITLCLTYYFFRKNTDRNMPTFYIALLGIFSATLLVTWHAHIHTAIILYPIMIFLIINNHMKFDTLLVWFYAPFLIQFAYSLLTVLFPIYNQATKDFITGGRFFILNIFLLVWSFVAYSKIKKEPEQDTLTKDEPSIAA